MVSMEIPWGYLCRLLSVLPTISPIPLAVIGLLIHVSSDEGSRGDE